LPSVRVLVVEDEVRLAEFIQEGLNAEGFDVEVTDDGLDGLWRARERPYDAIVLDILLPGMNGYKVCRTLREGGVCTPISMLTAKTGEYDEAEALDTGADDFLSKPFSFVVLAARLRALARRGATPQCPELVAGDLTLDPARHTCRQGDVPVELTRREFALLEALVRYAGDNVAKARLLSEEWGDDFDGDDNVVEVYVRYLRRKIDGPFGRRSLQTVRSISGYRLDRDGSALASPSAVGAGAHHPRRRGGDRGGPRHRRLAACALGRGRASARHPKRHQRLSGRGDQAPRGGTKSPTGPGGDRRRTPTGAGDGDRRAPADRPAGDEVALADLVVGGGPWWLVRMELTTASPSHDPHRQQPPGRRPRRRRAPRSPLIAAGEPARPSVQRRRRALRKSRPRLDASHRMPPRVYERTLGGRSGRDRVPVGRASGTRLLR
jgi:DNA-binding response OmpR family regulator